MRFLHRGRWDDERAREIDAYLEIETGENIARGMPPEEARHAARRRLGNVTLIREEIYQMDTIAWVDAVWHDLAHGARLLRLNPGFALVAILSLALGIGANTAIFQLIDAVRLRTLPVLNPQQIALVRIKNTKGARGSFNTAYPAVTNPIWERLRDSQRTFTGVLAWGGAGFNLADRGPARFTDAGLWVSGDFFNVLGVSPALGRLFTAADDRRGCAPAAVISYAFWQRERGADRSVIGRRLSLDRHPFEIVGVTEKGFFGPEVGSSFDVAVPLCADPIVRGENTLLDAGTVWWLTVMGRLKRGVTIDTASADLASLSPGIFEYVPANYPRESVATYRAFTLAAAPAGTGLSALRSQYADSLLVLFAIAGVVLLIASANLANLMLARASAREREIAVRLAIGASRARVIRQLLAESLLLSAIGAAIGAALAGVLSRTLIAYLTSEENPVFLALAVDWRLFAFTAAVAVACAMVFGLAPALRATRIPAGAVLKIGGRGLTADRERFALRRALVVAQVALSLALLVCALLFVGTFRNLATLDPGFEQEGVSEVAFDFRRLDLPMDRRTPMTLDLLNRLRSIPGVDGAADAAVMPLSGASWSNAVWMDGAARTSGRESKFNWVGAGYFATLRVPLLAGRDFDERLDSPGSPRVAIVNQSFVRQFAGGTNPVGRWFWIETTPTVPQARYEIVGLVKDTKYQDLRSDAPPIAYLPTVQQARPGRSVQIVLRSSRPPADLVPAIERTVAAVNPEIGFASRVLKSEIRSSLQRERLMATLSGFFGLLAAALATVGLYGIMSYTVARRRAEIGIRLALGAGRRDVIALIVGDAAQLVAVGLAAGVVLALAATQTARTLLFGLEPNDPATLMLAVASLAAVAAIATYLPAARAARLEPTVALREEC